MKYVRRIIIPVLFLLLITICGFSVDSVLKISKYSKLVNYTGIVRGVTQRIIKLELVGQHQDELIQYVDSVIKELTGGEGDVGLARIDSPEYNSDLKSLDSMWKDLKGAVFSNRDHKDTQKLITLSENFFKLANDTVFAVDNHARAKTAGLTKMIIFLCTVSIVAWVFILFAYMRRYMKMQDANDNLKNIAYRDELTGADNLEKFKIDAQFFLEHAKNVSYAVFYIDFENFKYLNDVFGYEYGDVVLKKYAVLLAADMGENETCGRISADNFVALRHFTTKKEVLKRQMAVDERIAEFTKSSKEKYNITVCSGICCLEDIVEPLKIEGLLDRANFAQKTVKNKPRAHYAFYNEGIRNQMMAEKAIENRMFDALHHHEFVVYFQPKMDLKTDSVGCAEALVRWLTPDKGLIPPNEFIPIFEKNLFVIQLDQYVFEEVCHWMRGRLDQDKPVLPVSVNVSRMQFYNPDFVQNYADIKKKYRIPDGLLEVEFTESVVFENMELLLQIIKELKQEGFVCSLDDFGKGYSSLNLLKNLPVDVLKLDSMFFQESDDTIRDHVVIEGIIAMVRKLNITIVAEGVEQQNQVRFLKDTGCDLIQGYVYYKPMPIDKYEELLEANQPVIFKQENRT